MEKKYGQDVEAELAEAQKMKDMFSGRGAKKVQAEVPAANCRMSSRSRPLVGSWLGSWLSSWLCSWLCSRLCS